MRQKDKYRIKNALVKTGLYRCEITEIRFWGKPVINTLIDRPGIYFHVRPLSLDIFLGRNVREALLRARKGPPF